MESGASARGNVSKRKLSRLFLSVQRFMIQTSCLRVTRHSQGQIYQNIVLGLKENESQAESNQMGQFASFPPPGLNNFGQQPQGFGSPGFAGAHRGGFAAQPQPEGQFGFDGGFRGRGRGRGGWRGRGGGDFRGQDNGFRGRGTPRGGRGGFGGQGSSSVLGCPISYIILLISRSLERWSGGSTRI